LLRRVKFLSGYRGGMLRHRLSAALLLCLAASLRAADEPGPDILVLFDQFVSAGAAASRCASPTDPIAVRFLSNFQWVSAHATREISRRSPQASSAEIASALARRSQTVKDETHALVRAEGCDSTLVRELVQRFVVQSTWQPGGA
jgi:hypothetical protein